MSKLWHKLVAMLSILMVMAAVLPTGAPKAQAATNALTEMEAVELLQHYSIVRGSPGGQLDLDQPFTRAQAATVFVRTMGFEELAQSLRSVVPFSDAVGHWAAGEIAMAEQLGLMRGDGNGTFRPDSQISYAEVLTVLLRIVKQEPTGAWNPDVIYTTADRLGFAPRGVLPTTAAVRGKIFWSLASAITQVPLPSGETVIQKYVDNTPPVLSLDDTSVTTADATVTITGTTRDAVAVLVNGNKATLNVATGRFTYTANLSTGANTFKVEARDYAGNTDSATFTAERKGAIATLDIDGPAVIKAGTSTKLTVTAKDSKGANVSLEGVQASLTGDVATFDIRTSTLTAGSKTGRCVLTLTAGTVRKSFTFDVTAMASDAKRLAFVSINNGRAPSLDKDVTVQVQVLDADGRLASDDYWRSVRLTATGLDGVRITPATVTTEAGVATFTVRGTEMGTATLVATSGDLEQAEVSVQFLTSPRIVLNAYPLTLKPDGTSSARITAILQDENGRAVNNTSVGDINITLRATNTDGYFTDSYLTIRKGYSSSDDAYFKAGVQAGTALITGTITTTQNYAIQNLSLPLAGTPTPVRLMVVPNNNRLKPDGTPTDITIQVVDSKGTVVTWGSWAYRLKVTTSNNEPVVNGLPEGVTLTFPTLDYGPYNTSTTSNALPGRTYQGKATVKLGYNKSGIVTVTPELVGVVEEAYNPNLGTGPASSTLDLQSWPSSFTFAGDPVAVQLTVDSALGNDKPGGAVSSATSMTLNAKVVDEHGAVVPGYNGVIRITRSTAGDKVTRLTGTSADAASKTAVNGIAEFTVQSTTTTGFDVYTATAGTLTPASTTVAVRRGKTPTPEVIAIRGAEEDALAPVVGYVAPDHDYMDIQLAVQSPPNPGEPTYWVSAKVVRKGSTSSRDTTILSDYPVNLASDIPTVRVPKSALTAGTAMYVVAINDGGGISDYSPDNGGNTATNAVYSTGFKITGAYYDAETTRLGLSTAGLATTGTFNPAKLTIVKDKDHKVSLDDSAVTITSVTSTSVVLQLNELASQLDPTIFSGDIEIDAADGWYESADRTQVAKATTDVKLKPMAVITRATLNRGSRKLVLQGRGFSTGTLNLAQVSIGNVALRPGRTSSYDQFTTTDTELTITLSTATFNAITALPVGESNVTAASGWLTSSFGGFTYKAAPTSEALPLQVSVTVNSAPYTKATNTLTISGRGFTGFTLDPTKLSFKRSTGTTSYRLVEPAVATVVSDTTITLVISDTDAAYFESTSGFAGAKVFLNTDDGWMTDAEGHSAAPIDIDEVYFTVTR